jgi:hypothetical protein
VYQCDKWPKGLDIPAVVCHTKSMKETKAMTVYSPNKAQPNAVNAKPVPEAAPKSDRWRPSPVRLVVYGVAAWIAGSVVILPYAFRDVAAPVASTPAPAPVETPVAAAPAPEPAHELAWLAEDLEMAKRMKAECGDATQEVCKRFWEMKREASIRGYRSPAWDPQWSH